MSDCRSEALLVDHFSIGKSSRSPHSDHEPSYTGALHNKGLVRKYSSGHVKATATAILFEGLPSQVEPER
jgi:hypothetical protein